MSGGADVLLSDVLTQCSTVRVFYGLLRDVDDVYDRLSDESQQTMVLAPQDSAMVQLQRKPWETLNDFETFGQKPYEGDDGKERADKNLKRFVKEHVLDTGFMSENTAVKNLNGGSVWYDVENDLDYQMVRLSAMTLA
jgi:hypothetical protein